MMIDFDYQSDAWRAGHAAFFDGLPSTACPYETVKEATEWDEGWFDAQAEGK